MTPAEHVSSLLRGYAANASASPLTQTLLQGAADDVDEGGPTWSVLVDFAGDGYGTALPLRFAAAVHRLVLERRAPLVALHYPSVGGTAPVTGVWPAALALVEAEADALRELTALPCQTNEVGRTVALLRALAELGPGPVRLLEVGSSAGLQLWFDSFDFAGRWGDPASPCRLPAPAKVPGPGLTITRRVGCDPSELDPLSPEGRLRLTSSIWGDQLDRFERLRGALAVAELRGRPPVTRAPAGEWLRGALAEPFDGRTVVWHSVVRQYVDPEEWSEVVRLADTVHHVAYEPRRDGPFELVLDGRLLATGAGHGGVITDT